MHVETENAAAALRNRLQSAAAQAGQLTPRDAGPVSTPAVNTPAAIYHAGQRVHDVAPPNASGAVAYARLQNTLEEDINYDSILSLLGCDIDEASFELRVATDAAMSLLSPELAQKDWSFSVRNNALVFSEGEDVLTRDELKQLREAFNTMGVPDAARKVADTVITAIRYEREWGADDVAMGIGRFDVSQKNFDAIVDLRAYLGEFGIGKGIARYLVDPTDVRAQHYGSGRVMMDIIAKRAEPRFAGREDESVEWNTTRVAK